MLNTYDHHGVTVVELDRGPVNALDLELLGALTVAVDRADSPVVLTGAGRTFSAGVDLRRIVEGPDSYVADFLNAVLAEQYDEWTEGRRYTGLKSSSPAASREKTLTPMKAAG